MDTKIRTRSTKELAERPTHGEGGGHSAPRRNGFARAWGWGIFFAGLAAIAVAWYHFVSAGTGGAADETTGTWSARILVTLAWVQSQGLMAAFWLIVLQALLVVFVIPGPYFTVGAGFIFGLAGGSAVAVAGSAAGAVTAYGIARAARTVRSARSRRLRNSVDATLVRAGGWGQRLADHPRLRMLERLILLGDWKVILSTRLIPFFPFKLSNYLFGWLRYPFAPFFWGTLLGIVPITMVSVSAGALMSDLSGLTNPDLLGGAGWGWSLAALGTGIILLVWSGHRARALYRQARDAQGGGEAKDGARGEVFR